MRNRPPSRPTNVAAAAIERSRPASVDGKAIKLELVDADYELKVYAAATGELKHEAKSEARDKECPFV